MRTIYAAITMKKQANRGMGELALIEADSEGQPRDGARVALGIGDDCAILRPPAGCEVLVTTDFTLEGRHFRRDLHTAESVGHRCLARGLSDLAAMGASADGGVSVAGAAGGDARDGAGTAVGEGVLRRAAGAGGPLRVSSGGGRYGGVVAEGAGAGGYCAGGIGSGG